MVGELLDGRAQRGRAPSPRSSATSATCASARARVLRRLHAQGQHQVRRPVARLARDRRDRLARRVSVRRAHAGHRGRDAPAWSQGCIELGLTIIPRGGGTGYTGGAIPLTLARAVINTEKLEATDRGRDDRAARASTEPVRDDLDASAGVVTQRVMPTRPSAPASCSRSTRPRPSVLHRRQRRDERRRQEGRAVGHGARQPRVVAHGDAGRRVARGRRASTTTSARSTTPPMATLRAARTSTPTARRSSAPRRSTIPGARFRKEGLGKDVTDKFLAGLPGIQKEGCDGLITVGALDRAPDAAAHAHGVPRVLRPGARRGARRSSRSRTSCSPSRSARGAHARGPRAPRRALPEGGRLRDQGEARRAAEDGAVRRHRRRRRRRGRARRLRSGAHRQRARRRRLRRRQRRGAQEILARPRAHRGDRASTPTPSRSTRTW